MASTPYGKEFIIKYAAAGKSVVTATPAGGSSAHSTHMEHQTLTGVGCSTIAAELAKLCIAQDLVCCHHY